MIHAVHDGAIGPCDDCQYDTGQPDQPQTQALCGSVSNMAHLCVCIQLLHEWLSSAWGVANTVLR